MKPALRATLRARGKTCPDCAIEMKPYACEGTLMHKCDACHGIWLTGKPLGVFRNALKKLDFEQLEIYLHPGLTRPYVISYCTRCRQVLEEFQYSYNSGVRLYRCRRCDGMWMPLTQMVNMMRSVKMVQEIEGDVRALLAYMRERKGVRGLLRTLRNFSF